MIHLNKMRFILVILLCCIYSVSIYSEDKKKSVYIGSVLSLNLPNGTDTRVRNGITLSLINNFKNKLSVLDDEVVKKLLDKKRKEIKNNQAEARSVLVRAGIFTEKGNLRKVYKDICTQPSLA